MPGHDRAQKSPGVRDVSESARVRRSASGPPHQGPEARRRFPSFRFVTVRVVTVQSVPVRFAALYAQVMTYPVFSLIPPGLRL